MKVLFFLLYPFAIVFDVVTSIRNRLYDRGYKPIARFDAAVISVGNLAVGGTGKTPMIEYLIRLLKADHKVATLSRGYGRITRGFRIAGETDNASTLGDEPFQFYKKFNKTVTVAVGEERAMAIPYIIDHDPDISVILLDDAFQHRKVAPSFQVLLTSHDRPFYKDFLLPTGRLRESRQGAQRADVIVMTKCPPELSEEEMMEIGVKIRKFSAKPVFFTAVHYGNIIPISPTSEIFPDKVILVSGIANAKLLVHYMAGNFKLVRHFNFADHHNYTEKDMEMITSTASASNAAIITTEKDAVKMEADKFKVFLSRAPFFYLPIETVFLKNGKDFDEMVLNVIKNA